MSSVVFGWAPLLRSDAPKGRKLCAALFTTYESPDDRFFATRLLPSLLEFNHQLDGEGSEPQYFRSELDNYLKKGLHQRLFVVSSAAREESGESAQGEYGDYGWIWRSICHLRVGSTGKEVQHAKLWLLHWKSVNDDEYLEIVVSSANLTAVAFRDQVQAAWRTCIKVAPKGSNARLGSWGILPDFIGKLASSAGDDTRLDLFIDLLKRAECPGGVTFVASAPGTYNREELRHTAWGAAGLRQIMPVGAGTVSVSILSPFVGSWNAKSLGLWCGRFNGKTERLHLVWIDSDHPCARDDQWRMPNSSLTALNQVNADLLQLRREPGLYEDQAPADSRWSHAKVYAFQRGNSHRLLVTSANFSQAAWGSDSDDGNLKIKNFELGVSVEGGRWPFKNLKSFGDRRDAVTMPHGIYPSEPFIAWARAVWDGKKIEINFRCKANLIVKGEIKRRVGKSIQIGSWSAGVNTNCRSARIHWADQNQPPTEVQFACAQEKMTFTIFDGRPPGEQEDTMVPGIDEEYAQKLKDDLLFERYGGRVAPDSEDEQFTKTAERPPKGPPLPDGSENEPECPNGKSDDFSVLALVLARRQLSIVDNWAFQLMQAQNAPPRAFIWHDGELLIEAFKRQSQRDRENAPATALGARLSAEELTLRLKYFTET